MLAEAPTEHLAREVGWPARGGFAVNVGRFPKREIERCKLVPRVTTYSSFMTS
jgi:hypothetical protein